MILKPFSIYIFVTHSFAKFQQSMGSPEHLSGMKTAYSAKYVEECFLSKQCKPRSFYRYVYIQQLPCVLIHRVTPTHLPCLTLSASWAEPISKAHASCRVYLSLVVKVSYVDKEPKCWSKVARGLLSKVTSHHVSKQYIEGCVTISS